jgi:hypothetical protein
MRKKASKPEWSYPKTSCPKLAPYQIFDKHLESKEFIAERDLMRY